MKSNLVYVNVKGKMRREPSRRSLIVHTVDVLRERSVEQMVEAILDRVHPIFRGLTGLKLVSDLHERPTWPGMYPPLDPVLRRRLSKIRDAGVLFVHIPKNAGISISTELYGEPLFHPTIRYYKRVAPDIVATMPSFAIWRDPVERFVSAYRFGRNGGAPGARLARAFRPVYGAFRSLDDALEHVETAPSLYHTDHIFRPQFWYVADWGGRIGVDQLCLIQDLDALIGQAGLPGISKIGHANMSPPLTEAITAEQQMRLRRLYAIDFAIYEALRTQTLPRILKDRMAA
jgi:hypothetical protein